jgi:hypothetical protein
MTNKPEPDSKMKLLLNVSGALDPKNSQDIKKKKTKKGNESSKMKASGNIKKTNKEEGRMLEATDISGMKVSNIFNDPSSYK